MPILFLIPPIIKKVRKKRAVKKGVEFKPLQQIAREKGIKMKNSINLKMKR